MNSKTIGPSLSERVKYLRVHVLKMETSAELAKRLGVTPASISKLENGLQSDMLGKTADNLIKLVEPYGYDHRWLFRGGPIIRRCDGLIPIVGNTQAGPGRIWFNSPELTGDYDAYIDLKQMGDYYGLRVIGDSMLPSYVEGEAVIVDPTATVVPGEVVVVCMMDDEYMLKRLASVDDREVVLESTNRDYSRIVRPITDIRCMHMVIGKVTRTKIVNITDG